MLTPVSRSHHGDRRWRRPDHYRHASQSNLALLTLSEIPKAAMSLPLVFLEQDQGLVLAAAMALTPGVNLFVAPDGRWLGRYIPAAFRGYPFALARAEDDRLVFCIDEDGGALSDDATGEPLFGADGELSAPVAQVLNFLQQVEQERARTNALCAELLRRGLVEPWSIRVREGDAEREVGGLYRINEQALNALEGEDFLALRAAGLLPLIYCQLLSMQHLDTLGELAAAQARAAVAAPVHRAAPFRLQDDDTLCFE